MPSKLLLRYCSIYLFTAALYLLITVIRQGVLFDWKKRANGGTVVELMTRDSKLEGSITATAGIGRYKMAQQIVLQLASTFFQLKIFMKYYQTVGVICVISFY
jgi:hypothetical protein